VSFLLDHLVMQPLMVIYTAVWEALYYTTWSAGWTLVLFSLVLNTVLLPIYYQMEGASRNARGRLAAMKEETARMKAHFKGRELHFYIRTVHRQFGYGPLSVILSSGDLFLQILVFFTVYRFITWLPWLSLASFGPIADLDRPDGLLWGANLLPVVMTLANAASAAIYATDRSSLRGALVMAGMFFLLLYASPSGLVLYWTCNNLYSLLRNMIERKVLPRLAGGGTQTPQGTLAGEYE